MNGTSSQIQVRVLPEEIQQPDVLRQAVQRQLRKEGRPALDLDVEIKVRRRSWDARKRPVKAQLLVEWGETPSDKVWEWPSLTEGSPEVLIVGAGPAGLYAALECLQHGVRPVVVERGKDVRARRRDLAKLNKEHLVHPDSNYCFGEGGAGTYSDGKLYTRSKKRGDVREALEWLVAHGADPEILVEAHPHIGTNRLPAVVTAMRETIEKAGGKVLFGHRVSQLLVDNGRCTGVKAMVLHPEEEEREVTLCAKAVVLATGHSARDIFECLHAQGLDIEAKPFALGVRVEHPQTWVDHVQYHGEQVVDRLPPASYSLVCQVEGRGVHSFCMCPGGIVAPCATAPGEVVTNGWSPSKRNNPYANSGMVVQIGPEDWEPLGFHGPLGGLAFQQHVERTCWEAAGGSQAAPAQRLKDFVAGRKSASLPKSSYVPGTTSVRVDQILPDVVSKSLKKGFESFGQKMRGFLHDDAVVLAPESRTSSPVRIPRDPDTLQHPGLQGLYPAGEGGGYAGGILSAAMDGRKTAQAAIHAWAQSGH